MTRSEHLLTVVAEEGGEVAKEVSKALRFGLDDKITMDPTGPRGTEGQTNREKIRDEFIDMLGAYQKCVDEGILEDIGLEDLGVGKVRAQMAAKCEKIESYMGYAARVGALDEDKVVVLEKLKFDGSFEDNPFIKKIYEEGKPIFPESVGIPFSIETMACYSLGDYVITCGRSSQSSCVYKKRDVGMEETKRRKLEAAGWETSSVAEFLGLTEAESREVEARLGKKLLDK